eukprot:1597843-Amphidinium_carterae.1
MNLLHNGWCDSGRTSLCYCFCTSILFLRCLNLVDRRGKSVASKQVPLQRINGNHCKLVPGPWKVLALCIAIRWFGAPETPETVNP